MRPATTVSDRLNHGQFELTTFDQPMYQTHKIRTDIQRKREQKQAQKRVIRQEILVSARDRHRFNSMKTAGKFFQTLKPVKEKYTKGVAVTSETCNIKIGQLKKVNDYINPILTDMDPSQWIEDEFKHYHQPVFCWRFQRTLIYLDQSSLIIMKGAGGVTHGQDNRVVKIF